MNSLSTYYYKGILDSRFLVQFKISESKNAKVMKGMDLFNKSKNSWKTVFEQAKIEYMSMNGEPSIEINRKNKELSVTITT